MVSFSQLSSLIRALFALWALLLCLINIVSGLLSMGKKRYLFSAISLVLFLPVFFMWQAIFDLSLTGKTDIATVTQLLCAVKWVWWLVAFCVLTVATSLLLIYNIRYKKNYITPNSIKLYLDKIPCGVCCWRDNGRVLFSNICMNELCRVLTHGPLLNGNQFFEAVAEGILTVEGKMWRFSCREITIGEERLHEMIASDITNEYAKTQALERDKAELSRLNKELREYTLGIDETVRKQEILQAKVNIHDEMNRLMLSTMVAESEDAETLDKIFSLWEQNALLLCMEGEDVADKKETTRLVELAEALKIRLSWEEDFLNELAEEQRSLFFSAAQEAVANAAKHAQAKKMELRYEKTEKEKRCIFSNDGVMPDDHVSFTGGLANLSRLAERQGATVSVAVGKDFTLTLTFYEK